MLAWFDSLGDELIGQRVRRRLALSSLDREGSRDLIRKRD